MVTAIFYNTTRRVRQANNTVEVPQDIIDNVIAAVGYNPRMLKKCSLVSSSFLRPCRKQLFSKISINDKTCEGIHQFLVRNPDIQSCVRSIILKEESSIYPEWMNSTSLLAILRLSFCCLESFSIILGPDYRSRRSWDSWDWNGFKSEMKEALLNMIQSSTLKTLSLKGITKVSTTFFLHIVHLTTLELHFYSPSDFGGETSSSLTRAASTSMASHTVIDRCVWYFRATKSEYRHGARFPSSTYLSLIQDKSSH